MRTPKLKSWRKIRDQLCAASADDTAPTVPASTESRWQYERAWSDTCHWAKQHGLLSVIQSLSDDDFRNQETFRSYAVLPENYSGEIGKSLAELLQETGWTKRKRQLLEALITCLQENGYLTVPGHGVRYLVSHIGGSFLYRVPMSQNGHLKPFRGSTVRVICTGSGPRTYRTYMIGTAGVLQ